MIKSLVLHAAVALIVVSSVHAREDQSQTEVVRLEAQLSRNGTVVASPVLRVSVGTPATMAITNGTTFTFTPTRIDANTLRIMCDVKQLQVVDSTTMRIDLRNQEQGVGTVVIGPDTYQVTLRVAQ